MLTRRILKLPVLAQRAGFTLPRFFVPQPRIRGRTITIDDRQELHHIRDVLRLGVGDRVACFDGKGREYEGVIARSAPKGVVVRVERVVERAEDAVQPWLAQGLLKADRFEWVVQKATELGIVRLSPLVTRHTVVRVSAEQREQKRQRWQRIAQEAAKQCRRAVIPAIDAPEPMETVLQAMEGADLVLLPTLAVTAIPLSEMLKTSQQPKRVGVLIGPEGDFSKEEVALAQRYGARPVSLGPRTLRSETAAVSTLAILSYVLGS